jgi:hypothetical protein
VPIVTTSPPPRRNVALVSSQAPALRDPLNPTPPFEIEGANQRLLELCAAADPKIPSSLRKRSERRLRNISRDIVDDRYAESNAAASRLTNLDLHSYGYA